MVTAVRENREKCEMSGKKNWPGNQGNVRELQGNVGQGRIRCERMCNLKKNLK